MGSGKIIPSSLPVAAANPRCGVLAEASVTPTFRASRRLLAAAASPIRNCHGAEEHLAFQLPLRCAVGESVFQHQVLPLLDDCSSGIPLDQLLKEDRVVPDKPLPLSLEIDLKGGVLRIQVDKGHRLEAAGLLGQDDVDSRPVEAEKTT